MDNWNILWTLSWNKNITNTKTLLLILFKKKIYYNVVRWFLRRNTVCIFLTVRPLSNQPWVPVPAGTGTRDAGSDRTRSDRMRTREEPAPGTMDCTEAGIRRGRSAGWLTDVIFYISAGQNNCRFAPRKNIILPCSAWFIIM